MLEVGCTTWVFFGLTMECGFPYTTKNPGNWAPLYFWGPAIIQGCIRLSKEAYRERVCGRGKRGDLSKMRGTETFVMGA